MKTELDYLPLINDPKNRIAAERLALKCGIRADLDGFGIVAEAAILYAYGVRGFNEIYRKLGEVHGVMQRSIMHDIIYLLRCSGKIAPRLAEFTDFDANTKPKPSTVISSIGEQLKKDLGVKAQTDGTEKQ